MRQADVVTPILSARKTNALFQRLGIPRHVSPGEPLGDTLEVLLNALLDRMEQIERNLPTSTGGR